MQHYSERLLTHVKRAEQVTQAAKEAAVREVGITAAQQSALAVLSDNPGINAAELARRCSVSPQTMNGLLSRLEARGYVDRRPHPLHNSVVELKLTGSGRAVFEEADALVARLDERLTAGLCEADLVMVREVLGRITENAARAMARAGSS
jgi:DNA-binding MarR family transcriptional regulator